MTAPAPVKARSAPAPSPLYSGEREPEASSTQPSDTPHLRARRHRAFTLIEVLVTLTLLAIVLPAVMQGVSLASAAANLARHRTEAAGLAESKLAEIIATREWQTGNLSGDFGPDEWKGYRWQAEIGSWAQDTSGSNIQQVNLRVIWIGRSKREESVMLSTLVYPRTQE